MATTEHVVTRTPAPAAAAKGAGELAKVEWECEFCHRNMSLNAKGSHLAACKLNPNSRGNRRQIRKGPHRDDLVPCEYCTKGISPQAMRKHVNHDCRVAAAVREGRVQLPGLEPISVPVLPDLATNSDWMNAALVDAAPPDAIRPYVFDRQLAEDIIGDAVDQILDGRFDDLPRAAQFSLFRQIANLVDTIEVHA